MIGPAEEFFWRGFLQDGLMEYFGRFWVWLMSQAAYGGAHIVSGNFTLIGAATVADAFWGGLYALELPLGALIVSHITSCGITEFSWLRRPRNWHKNRRLLSMG